MLHVALSLATTQLSAVDSQPLAVLATNLEALTRDRQVITNFLFRAGAIGHFHFRIHHLYFFQSFNYYDLVKN